ncbi:hypothetical protein CcCBS67573_g02371 [Chytriomyces confervae]|uniref:Hydrogen voltage-gated channel 1 n=1 Tax=Chytriomyces confervae TaxID=246404 RepID=A0A507FJF1_9FUNG|nr:hypothetical protein HDU80_007211 [Chytriomyces hyalinus]TPX76352.1 hypothetical protein CcCBS67573_g02371 [Chytriomyces confervae]
MTRSGPEREAYVHRLRQFIKSKRFHVAIIYLVLFDMVLIITDLMLALFSSCIPNEEGICHPHLRASKELTIGKEMLFWLSAAILFVFFLELVVSAILFGLSHFMNPLTAFDAAIINIAIVVELYYHFSGLEKSGGNAVVILRILKLIRVMHAVAHAAAYLALQRVEELETIHDRIVQRARIMNQSLTLAHTKVEKLFETVAPFESGESGQCKQVIGEIYQNLKLVVKRGDIGLEEEVEALLASEGCLSRRRVTAPDNSGFRLAQ